MIQIRWRQRLLHPVALALGACMMVSAAHAADTKKPNIVIIWGDDIGQTNVSAYSKGMMGYKTPNIDRLAKMGTMFSNNYCQQSVCPIHQSVRKIGYSLLAASSHCNTCLVSISPSKKHMAHR